MSTTKEQLLDLLKASMTTLVNKQEELATNRQFQQAWHRESELITSHVASLPPEDVKWLNDEYSKWAKTNLTAPLKEFIDKGLQKDEDPENKA
ncbi:MAG: hypothetical protein ACYSUN_12320 [Planctomycetota bacterium]|jgi:hypothetical protein